LQHEVRSDESRTTSDYNAIVHVQFQTEAPMKRSTELSD
jgi:hypothetical protein